MRRKREWSEFWDWDLPLYTYANPFFWIGVVWIIAMIWVFVR